MRITSKNEKEAEEVLRSLVIHHCRWLKNTHNWWNSLAELDRCAAMARIFMGDKWVDNIIKKTRSEYGQRTARD